MASVQYKDVDKIFAKGQKAVDCFNLDIADGELIVLVGSSGCGKSTLLRMLAGLETVSQGEIRIDDKIVNDLTPQQRNIAMVFQNYALYPHMTVHENLTFPLRMARQDKHVIQKRIEDIAAILQISQLLTRKPKELSGGQSQRVAMGRALVRDPSVFLLDEPLSNLDAKLRTQIRAEILDIQKRLNKTTLYVTHDQVEAMTLGDRVVVLDQGRTQQIGTPDTLYNNPVNTFVAKFIGNPGMNVLTASAVKVKQEKLEIDFGKQIANVSLLRNQGEKISQYTGSRINIGIRPENISVSKIPGAFSLNVLIRELEYLGHETLIHTKLTGLDHDNPNSTLIIRTPGKTKLNVHESIDVFIQPSAIYFFDESGNRIMT